MKPLLAILMTILLILSGTSPRSESAVDASARLDSIVNSKVCPADLSHYSYLDGHEQCDDLDLWSGAKAKCFEEVTATNYALTRYNQFLDRCETTQPKISPLESPIYNGGPNSQSDREDQQLDQYLADARLAAANTNGLQARLREATVPAVIGRMLQTAAADARASDPLDTRLQKAVMQKKIQLLDEIEARRHQNPGGQKTQEQGSQALFNAMFSDLGFNCRSIEIDDEDVLCHIDRNTAVFQDGTGRAIVGSTQGPGGSNLNLSVWAD